VEPFHPLSNPVEGTGCFGQVLTLHQLNQGSYGMSEREGLGTSWCIATTIDTNKSSAVVAAAMVILFAVAPI
jgi:phosphoribosylaminoimidazole (AIR) synthetase